MYSFQSRVRFSEVDSNLRMKLSSVIDYFQDCSTFHSDSVGDGIEAMKQRGYAWILASWQVIVDRYPALNEKITVSTWAYGWKTFFGFRNFTMRDAEGRVVAYANSNWIYVDIHTGHPARITKETIDAYAVEPQYPMEVTPRKLALPAQMEEQPPFDVRKSDIDPNHHVNNGRYIPMAEEYLPESFPVRQLQVEYRNAAVYGDTIYPAVHTDDTSVTVSLNNIEGTPYAVVKFTAADE